MKITEFLNPDAIIPELRATTKDGVLEELAAIVERNSGTVLKDRVLQALQERERLGSTGIGDGVAIPHGKLNGLNGMVGAFGRSSRGLDFQAIDGKPTHIFFLLLAPEDMPGLHLKALSKISRLLKEPSRRKGLMEAMNREEIFRLIAEGDDRF